jgi:hypothetical protein
MSQHTDDPDHEELADTLEHRADELSERSEHLEDEIRDARSDWDAKRHDDGVVGGPPPREED